jgi:hypothetical protein
LGWKDYRDLLAAAHQQLGAPMVVVWDKARIHWLPGLRGFAADHDWLTLVALLKLKRIQYRPELVDGCLAETSLMIHPP